MALMAAIKAGSPSVQELRSLMEDVKTIKAEREVLEQQLKGPIADITCIIITSEWQNGYFAIHLKFDLFWIKIEFFNEFLKLLKNSGHLMVADNCCECPSCHFPALYSKFKKLLESENTCPLCSAEISSKSIQP
uniref:Uncharacterized protein n=1 Tax=Amphimedon queenslandica TaxID=400682 RepID=A0A1X7TJR9_AMPQE